MVQASCTMLKVLCTSLMWMERCAALDFKLGFVCWGGGVIWDREPCTHAIGSTGPVRDGNVSQHM